MTADSKAKECVYCGSTESLTEDHVLPKSLFGRPAPSNLIKVPSCLRCNSGASQDDEYFRLTLVLREDTAEHPTASQAIPAVLRSLTKPSKRGFASLIAKSVTVVERLSPSGLYIDTVPVFDVDLSRLNRVAARVVKGLFYHERQSRLPAGYRGDAYEASGFARADGQTTQFLRDCATGLTSRTPRTIGDGVFSYWFQILDGDECCSQWLLQFYGKVFFFGFTSCEEQRNMT
jgi:hypothetical protein